MSRTYTEGRCISAVQLRATGMQCICCKFSKLLNTLFFSIALHRARLWPTSRWFYWAKITFDCKPKSLLPVSLGLVLQMS